MLMLKRLFLPAGKPASKNFCWISLIVFAVISGGCGYSTGSLLPTHLKTIYVDNFKNRIDIGKEATETSPYTLYRPGLENDVTNAIVERFVFDGNLKITDREEADLILTGSLTSYRQDALRYDSGDNVEEYRIRITVDMEIFDTVKNKVLWKKTGFAGEAAYKTTGQFATTEDTARDEAIEDLARRAVERTVENW